jgi:fructose-bisphosphate aldolase, class II
MPLVPTASLVVPGAGVGAFNVITLEHAEAIVAGAASVDRPVILQISQNAVAFHGGQLGPIAQAAAAVARSAPVDVALHLDHVESVALLRQAPGCGFGSVMADFSKMSYVDNVAATREVVEFAHAHNLWVESELGTVGGKDGEPPLSPHAPGARTDPDEAARYAAATGVDGLAVAVGSSHAMTDRSASLDLALIRALRDAVPVPLVLHGSSGVPDGQLRDAVRSGIVKVNVGTALNVAFTGAVRQALLDDAAVVDPRRYLSTARDAMAATVAHFLTVLAG